MAAMKLRELSIREKEIELRILERRDKQEKMDLQRQHQQEQLDLQRREFERQTEADALRLKEYELRAEEVKRQKEADAVRLKNENTLAARTRKFADAIKHVFVKMSEDAADAPLFFEGIENLFKMYEIPADIQSKLLLPLLNSKARLITARLSAKELDNYDVVKARVLAELKLTPREYLLRFKQACKQADETFTLFKARLSNLLTYYLRSRKADRDINVLFDLLIADRLKEALPYGALNYVLSLEGDATFEAAKVASSADVFVNNHTYSDSKKQTYAQQDDRQATSGTRVTAKTSFSHAASVTSDSQTVATGGAE
jgi:hypothetical protein